MDNIRTAQIRWEEEKNEDDKVDRGENEKQADQ